MSFLQEKSVSSFWNQCLKYYLEQEYVRHLMETEPFHSKLEAVHSNSYHLLPSYFNKVACYCDQSSALFSEISHAHLRPAHFYGRVELLKAIISFGVDLLARWSNWQRCRPQQISWRLLTRHWPMTNYSDFPIYCSVCCLEFGKHCWLCYLGFASDSFSSAFSQLCCPNNSGQLESDSHCSTFSLNCLR